MLDQPQYLRINLKFCIIIRIISMHVCQNIIHIRVRMNIAHHQSVQC